MKKILILSILLVVLVAGCINNSTQTNLTDNSYIPELSTAEKVVSFSFVADKDTLVIYSEENKNLCSSPDMPYYAPGMWEVKEMGTWCIENKISDVDCENEWREYKNIDIPQWQIESENRKAITLDAKTNKNPNICLSSGLRLTDSYFCIIEYAKHFNDTMICDLIENRKSYFSIDCGYTNYYSGCLIGVGEKIQDISICEKNRDTTKQYELPLTDFGIMYFKYYYNYGDDSKFDYSGSSDDIKERLISKIKNITDYDRCLYRIFMKSNENKNSLYEWGCRNRLESTGTCLKSDSYDCEELIGC
jgi:hypothetical protein